MHAIVTVLKTCTIPHPLVPVYRALHMVPECGFVECWMQIQWPATQHQSITTFTRTLVTSFWITMGKGGSLLHFCWDPHQEEGPLKWGKFLLRPPLGGTTPWSEDTFLLGPPSGGVSPDTFVETPIRRISNWDLKWGHLYKQDIVYYLNDTCSYTWPCAHDTLVYTLMCNAL